MFPIETERLRITTWQKQDLTDAQRLWGDPAVMALIDARGALSPAEVAEKLDQEISRQKQFGVQYWKVELRISSETIGACGLRPYNLDSHVYELGFHFMPSAWGRGYATEAARAVISYAFEEIGVSKLFAGHHPTNAASARTLVRLGFKPIGSQLYPATGLLHPSYELIAK